VIFRKRRAEKDESVPDLELVPAIHAAADCPCELHNQALLNALAQTQELFFCSPTAEQQSVVTSTVDGETLLDAYATLDAAMSDRGENAVIGIPIRQVLDIILGHPQVSGLLITNGDATSAWSTIVGDDIARLRTQLSPA